MHHEIQNGTDAVDHPATPYPAPAHFDENMIAVAQPVEPLAKGRSRRPSALRQFLKGRLGLLAVLLITGLLGAAVAGLLLGFRGTAESTAVETPAASPMANQSTDEPLKTSAPVHQPAKTSEILPRKSRQQLSTGPAKVDLPQPTGVRVYENRGARKVGEIYYGRGDRKEKKEKGGRRRHGDNDDDH